MLEASGINTLEKAQAVRRADQYALWFIPITLVIAGGAWLATGDPMRALSVLADRRRSFDLNVTPPLAIEALFHELHGAGSEIARVVEA